MHLNCHSYFSLRYGTMSVRELLQEARQGGWDTLALTDINNTSACLEFIREAPKYNIRPIVGIDFRNGVQQKFIGLARNNEGFLELNAFLSHHLHHELPIPDRAPDFEHAFIIYPNGSVDPNSLKKHEYLGVKASDLFQLRLKGAEHQEKLVALQSGTFRNKKDFNAHRLLRAIDNNILLSKLEKSEQASEGDRFLNVDDLKTWYKDAPHLLDKAQELLDACEINFEFGISKNKKTLTGCKEQDYELLHELAHTGLTYRYDKPTPEIIQRLEKELKVIRDLDFTSYFLINWDIVRFAQSQGFFYVGRGSGANSIVAYCLQITDVDPVDLDLYFERFINMYRKNPPDFDIDFSWKDRDAVTQYIFEKHGHENTALLATYNTFKRRSVIRELGKVFGLPKSEIDQLVSNPYPHENPDQIVSLVLRYSDYIQDFPSHLSIHAGGILISEEPINAYTATSIPPKGYPLTHFSMIEAEDIGLYKFDILSQRGLGHIRDTIQIVRENRGEDIDIHNIKAFKEDDRIKQHLRTGHTMGCFYVESPAMRMLLAKLQAETYLSLVAASSIIRPGVARSGMMREYVLRFRRLERRKDAHPVMWELMQDTFGIMVYQEDVIKVAHYFAGLTLSESDVLRRGMSGKFRSRDEFAKVRDKFFSNCRSKGYEEKVTAEVWHQIESFAGYSFSKGHSASYAVESYQSLFLKAYFPKEFMVGVINNFGGFYQTEYYIHEARMCGANIQLPCVNRSRYLTTIYQDDIYLGFIHMRELEQRTVEQLAIERNNDGPFLNLADFMKRVPVSVEQLRLLIRIGAFRFTGRTKKELLWDIHLLLGNRKKTQPRRELFAMESRDFTLPELHYDDFEDAMDEIELLGFPVSNTPFDLLRDPTDNGVRASDLMGLIGETVSLQGYMVTIKNTTTVKGDRMHFGAFLDRSGQFFDTTHFPIIAKNYPFRGRGVYLVTGKVTEEFDFPSIEVEAMEKLPLVNRDTVMNQPVSRSRWK